jgi:asparagine synthase (glutamine-hydrolysing)
MDDLGRLLARAGRAFDEPQAYGALLTAVAITGPARERGAVVLSGDGGDEAFGGYAWHRVSLASPERAMAACEHEELSRHVAAPGGDGRTRARALAVLGSLSFLHAHLQAVFPRFHPAEAAALFAPLEVRYGAEEYAAWAREHDRPALPRLRRVQRLDLLTFCAGSILPKIDRAAMGVGLEVRAPFLDRRVLEGALALPVSADEEAPRGAKPAVRRYLRGRVPDAILSRPKQGFSLRLGGDPWPGMVPWLRESALVRDGLLRRDFEGFIGADAPHRSGRILALCGIAAWYEQRRGGAIP